MTDTTYNDIQKAEAKVKRAKIRWLRNKKKLSWKEVAAELGISRQRVYELMRGYENEPEV